MRTMLIGVLVAIGLLDAPVALSAPPESVNLRRTIAVDVAERTKDAVVYVSTRKIVSQRFNPTGNPMFDQFDFGQTRKFCTSSRL